MRKIEHYIDEIKEETCGAMEYAEKYLEYKNSNPQWSRMYSEMAEQELNHAEYLRTIGQGIMDALPWVSEDCKEAWEKCGAKMSEKAAMTRLMLSK